MESGFLILDLYLAKNIDYDLVSQLDDLVFVVYPKNRVFTKITEDEKLKLLTWLRKDFLIIKTDFPVKKDHLCDILNSLGFDYNRDECDSIIRRHYKKRDRGIVMINPITKEDWYFTRAGRRGYYNLAKMRELGYYI